MIVAGGDLTGEASKPAPAPGPRRGKVIHCTRVASFPNILDTVISFSLARFCSCRFFYFVRSFAYFWTGRNFCS